MAAPAGGADTDADDWPLPPLRRDLRWLQGPRDSLGEPTWTLQDVQANRFFSLGWLEYEIIRRWDTGRSRALADAVRRDTGHEVAPRRLREVQNFLAAHHLVEAADPQSTAALAAKAAKAKPHPVAWMVHNYLYFRVPLVRPDRFLGATLPLVSWLMSRGVLLAAATATVLGAFLTVREWDEFQGTFPYFFSLDGALFYGLCLSFSKICHELGHAWVAKSFGCRVPTMGVAFLVVWPVLYADTSEAWKLPVRRHRLIICLSGMIAELTIAGLALFLWDLLPEGPARSTAVVVASTSWLLALTVNLNPFMRFDGYYVFQDLVGIDNLQPRAFALARWRLREALIGLGDPPPELLAPAVRRFLTAYAYATWLYRLVVFLGIAVMVYEHVFKLLGIVLMGIEIFYFILGPVVRELGAYWKRRDHMRWNRNAVLTLAALLACAGALVLPWETAVEVPAVLAAREHTWLYPPFPARLAALPVARGQKVGKDQLLAELEAPDLDQELRAVDTRIGALRWQLGHRETQPTLLASTAVMEQELIKRATERAGIVERQGQLRMTAPFEGTVTALADSLVPGRWLGRTTAMIEITDTAAARIEAFASEDSLGWIAEGATGTFYPDALELPPVPVRVSAIDRVAVPVLPRPQLASIHGGPIPVREDGSHRPVPERALYRVTLEPVDAAFAPVRVATGAVRLAAAPAPFLLRMAERAATVLLRESGF